MVRLTELRIKGYRSIKDQCASVDTSNPATRGRVKSGHHAGVASETG